MVSSYNQFLAFILFITGWSCTQSKQAEPINTVTQEQTISTIPYDTPNQPAEAEGMVWIPAGSYQMGGVNEQADQDEYPKHGVKINGFWMDINEVTNLEFQEFVEATDYKTIAERPISWEEIKVQLPPDTPKPADSLLRPGALVFTPTDGPVPMNNVSLWWEWVIGANWRHPEGPGSSIENRMNHPVVQIAWDDAVAYANWKGKRLPTESEWEWASRGGLNEPIYPWGNEAAERSSSKANFWQGFFPYQNKEQDGFYGTAPVKSYAPNGYGLYDMAGNVWEWCSDWYHYDAYKMAAQVGVLDNPNGPQDSFDPQEPYTPKKVVRGGSFLCNDSYCSGYRVSRRMKSSRDSGLNHTGFRGVLDGSTSN